MFAIIKDFTADKFTDTRWEKAGKKVRFASQFIRFVNADFAWQKFPLAFYRRLAQTWLFQNGILAEYEKRLAAETEASERAELNRLQAKWQR